MSKLRSVLVEAGFPVEGMDEKQLKAIARAASIELPREDVQIVDYTPKNGGESARYVKTSPFVIGTKEDGTKVTAKGLFLRVEAIDQAVEELMRAKGLLEG
jgi:hypothetical protein